MDKQHLAASIATVIGAGELILQTCGVKFPTVDANDAANSIAGVIVLGCTVWASIRHYVATKKIAAPVAPTAPTAAK